MPHDGTVSVLDTLLALGFEPHPALVASRTPSAAEVFSAAQYLGWYPAEPLLRPVAACGEACG